MNDGNTNLTSKIKIKLKKTSQL